MIWKRKHKGEGEAAPQSSPKSASESRTDGVSEVVEASKPSSPSDGVGVEKLSLNPWNTDRLNQESLGTVFSFLPASGLNEAVRSYRVPRSYRVSGDILVSRPVEVCGELEGRRLTAGLVTVLPGGTLRGEVCADTLRVAGLVDGQVQAKTVVDVASQGTLQGEIQSPSIRILSGAKVCGAAFSISGR